MIASAQADILAQNPITPELIRELGQLDTLQFMMVIVFFVLIILALAVLVLWRMVNQQGKQVDISQKNSDKLAVNTDAIQKTGQAAEATAGAMTELSKLTQQAVKASQEAQKHATATESGVNDLTKLVKSGNERTGSAMEQIVNMFSTIEGHFQKLLTDLAARDERAATASAERDSRITDEVTTIKNGISELKVLLMAHIEPTPAIAVDATMTIAPPVEPPAASPNSEIPNLLAAPAEKASDHAAE